MQHAIVPLGYSISDLSGVVPFGKTSIYKLIHEGHLVAIKVGRRTIITRESVESLMASAERLPAKTAEAA